MIKLESLGMLKVAKSYPVVVSHASIKNGYLHTVAAKKTVAPVAGASDAIQTKDICIAMNTALADDRYTDITIASGDRVNSFLIKQWDSQNLIIQDSDIDYGTGVNYASISAGTTKLAANASGNLDIVTDTSYYGVYFDVVEKIQYDGDAVLAKVVVSW